MRLLTLLSMRNPMKAAVHGHPLDIDIEEFDVSEATYHCDFIKHIIPTLDWPSLVKVSSSVGLEGFPEVCDPSLLEDDSFLMALHHLLININVIKGSLSCTETMKRFPIENGIACMMYVLHIVFVSPHLTFTAQIA
jgi:multifunctional methyltransferase subunit TRM112